MEQPIKLYSTGMRTRLAFAICAHMNAEILIVDEALSVGDLAFQKKCIDWIDNFPSHRNAVVRQSFDGRIVATMQPGDLGSTTDMCGKPATLRTLPVPTREPHSWNRTA